MNYFLHEFGKFLHEIGIIAYNLGTFSNYMDNLIFEKIRYHYTNIKYILYAFHNFCFKIYILHKFSAVD